MKCVLWIVVFLVTVSAVTAQPNPDTLWTARTGGSEIDYCHAIRQTADGGYVLAGETNSFGEHATDAYLVKLNSAGAVQWSEAYGAINTSTSNSFAAVQQTSDQGFILGGRTIVSNWTFPYVVKTDADGDTIWTRVFWDPAGNYDIPARGVLEVPGGYLIAGYAAYAFPAHSFIFLIKTNLSGDTVWTHFMHEREAIAFEACDAIIEASDGGYVLAGNRYVEGTNNVDALLMKVNATGAVEWTRFYDHEGYDAFSSIAETADGGYILAGQCYVSESQGMDMYVARVTSAGDTVWTRRFGGTSQDMAVSVHATTGGFVVAGQTRSFGAGSDDYYLIKLDANGQQLWSRTYGGSGYDWCDAMQCTSDGGYVLGGSTGSFGAQVYDLYVVKTGPDGAGGDCPALCADAYPISLGIPMDQCSFQEDGQHWFQIHLNPGLYRFQLDGFSGQADYDLYTYMSCTDPDPTTCSGLAVGPEDFQCNVTGGSLDLYIEVDTYQGPYGSYRLLVSSVQSAEPSHAGVPTEFSLSAYPNPFNPLTTIAFDLPQTVQVRLSVYDVSGRLVQTLLDTRLEVGRHEVEFDGRALPSGVYFARIAAGAFVKTQKLVLLK